MVDPLDELVYEHMLHTRLSTHGVAPYARRAELDRSATVLLARLHAEGPMSVGALADAFSLDVSTVHRQLASAMKAGLVERIPDPAGGAARLHRPTAEGARRLEAELDGRRRSMARVVEDWPEAEVATFLRLLRRFNDGVEHLRERPWPRPWENGGDQPER